MSSQKYCFNFLFVVWPFVMIECVHTVMEFSFTALGLYMHFTQERGGSFESCKC